MSESRKRFGGSDTALLDVIAQAVEKKIRFLDYDESDKPQMNKTEIERQHTLISELVKLSDNLSFKRSQLLS